MQKGWVRKNVVLGIIMLFVGASVIPNFIGYDEKETSEKLTTIKSCFSTLETSNNIVSLEINDNHIDYCNFDNGDDAVQSDSSAAQITFYFKDYLNMTNDSQYDSSGIVPLISMAPPTSSLNAYYPPYFLKEIGKQKNALSIWFSYWLFSTMGFFVNESEEWHDLFDAMKILLPHHLRIVEAYESSLNDTSTVDGDVIFHLDFKSRVGFKKIHDDYVKVSLYTLNPDNILPVPILIKNETVKIQQKILSPIHSQNIILENIQCTINPGDLLLFCIEIIPTNRTITQQWARNDTLTHLIVSKISGILLKIIQNSNNPKLIEISQFIALLQNISDELNVTNYDFANLANAILGPSLVYDSSSHPSSVTVPFSSLPGAYEKTFVLKKT